jgi:hypothetical protein
MCRDDHISGGVENLAADYSVVAMLVEQDYHHPKMQHERRQSDSGDFSTENLVC